MPGIKDYFTYDQMLQERGYKPVLILVSVNDYEDYSDRRVIVSNVPDDVYLHDLIDYGVSKSRVIGKVVSDRLSNIASEINSALTNVSGQVTDKDRALSGCAIDLTIPTQQSAHSLNIIFQNPLMVGPSGDEFYGSDFLKCGFPVWVMLGYINKMGEVVGHPFDTEKHTSLPIVFSGLIGSLDQELTINAGDRLLVEAASQRWYFSHFKYGIGRKEETNKLTVKLDATLEITLNNFFTEFYNDKGATIPEAILSVLGITISHDEKKLPTLIDRYKPNIKFHPKVDKNKLPVKTAENDLGLALKDNYLTILKRIENLYQVDINWEAQDLLTTNIIVTPRLDPYNMIFDEHDKVNEAFELRIHQMILGGNVRDCSFRIDAEGSINQILISIVDPDTAEISDSLLLTKSTMDQILTEWKERSFAKTSKKPLIDIEGKDLIEKRDAQSKNPTLRGLIRPANDDMERVFGKKTRVLNLTISKHDIENKEGGTTLSTGETIPYPREALEAIVRRLHYWGARGSAMMMGNAQIREGDLVEIFDRRPKGTTLLGFNMNVTGMSLTPFIERFKSIANDSVLRTTASRYSKEQYLGLSLFDNIYYIWKVKHYFGPEGYWTKIWFIKQRDALSESKSSIFKNMVKHSKKIYDEDDT